MPLEFRQSPRSTLGVEWELQLIDSDSSNLRQCGDFVISEVERRYPKQKLIHKEMLLNTVELVSRPRQRVAECISDLKEALAMVDPITKPLRIDLATAGSHPFANPIHQQVTDNKRYAKLVERTQYWGRQMLLFGTHVHVGIEQRSKVLPIMNYVLTKSGHIQALTAASPYWAGIDTGYADNRAMVFQQLPTAGTPRQFSKWQDLEAYTEDCMKTSIISSFDEIRWDIRPSPKLGTIEVRVADASSNLKEVGALAALVHSLVEYASRQLDAGRELPQLPAWYVGENKWRSARYGIEAVIIEDAAGNELPLRDSIPTLLDMLEPVAADLGCAKELRAWEDIVKIGVGYERQRQVQAKYHDLEAIVELMRAEMNAGHPISPADFIFSGRGDHPLLPSGQKTSHNCEPEAAPRC